MRLRQVSEWTDLILRIVDRVDNFNFEDMHVLFQRRKELCCEGKCIGIMPILYPEESPILYGSESYEVVHSEPVRVNLEIENTDYGIFLPALYEANSNPLEIIDGNRITRLMVYEGSFRALIRLGDKLDVVGTLQKVYPNPNYQKTDEESEAFYQIMVGTKQGAKSEFIRVIQ
jgi:predicted nucleotidyltransferase